MPGFIGPAALVLAAVLLSEVPEVRAAGQAIDRYRGPLLAAAIGLAGLGFAVFMGGILSMLMVSGAPKTQEEIERGIGQRQGIGQAATWRFAAHRVFGAAAGQQASYEASFTGIKDDWRTGEWWRDTHWRRVFLISVGGVMLSCGLFALVLVLAPIPIKALVAAVATYAAVMTAWGFART